MNCCRAGPCEETFKPRFAQKSLERYRKKGLGEHERLMVASAVANGVDGARVLEIGGGIGAIQAELLAAGALQGEIIELVSAFEPYAHELARAKGLEGRSSFRVADILSEPAAADPADVVVLNRVVCCSPEGVALAGAAGRLTRSTLLLSFPRDVVWVRAGIRLLNAGLWLARRSFRVFVHPRTALVAAAEAEGMQVGDSGCGALWEWAAFRRAA